jgi:hypothetical protein
VYEVDERDRVVELKDVPQSSVGAPIPCVLADEHHVVVAFYAEQREFWQAPPLHRTGQHPPGELVVLVRFNRCMAHLFGPPNDEAFAGHPLASRGLRPYGAYRIEESSWIRKLERMNSVHRSHRPERFWKKQHLVFAFHDSTFECVCDGFDVTQTRGSITSAIPEMVKLLGWDLARKQ